MKNRKMLLIGLSLLVLILLAVGCSESEKKDPNAWKTQDYKIEAFVMMQQFVTQNLKSPSTAKFPYSSDDGVVISNEGDQTYSVEAYVDSQNAFGAMLRTKYVGKIQQVSKDKWKLLSLKFLE